MWETANKYLIMGLISFETLFQTILLTMFFIISKGWGIIRFYVEREEATHVTIALGVVYLCYSAFFVTIELPSLNRVVKVFLLNLIDIDDHCCCVIGYFGVSDKTFKTKLEIATITYQFRSVVKYSRSRRSSVT